MDNWTYLVPEYHGSPWYEKQGSQIVTDREEPRVGIYCPHDPAPWLIGSFTVSGMVLEERGEVLWSFENKWMSGDGYLFNLAAEPVAYLVDKTPYRRNEVAERLRDAVERHGFGSGEAAAIAAEQEQAQAKLRARPKLRCRICQDGRDFRSENVQAALGLLWATGRREVTLQTFIRWVEVSRRVDPGA